MGCRCDRVCGLVAGAVIGSLVAVLGGILIPVGNNIIQSTVKKEAVIEPNTTAYENWVSAGAPVYRQFWIFEIENPKQVVDLGETPKVKERGPYTYRTRYLPKVDITAYEDHTVSFSLPAGAIFEPSMSVGTEEDVVTTLNLVVAGAYSVVPHIILEALIRLTNSSLFEEKTVKELLWGYHDPIQNTTIGVFYPYNGTADGPYNIFTGKDDISKVNIINSWQDKKTLSFWGDKYCDMINGTDASSFPPFVDKNRALDFFSSDICRSVTAEYTGSHNLKGIDVYRYELPRKTLASPYENPDNNCFCRDPEVTKNCTMAGVLDISSCKNGTPVYISLPHFLHGNVELTQQVQGLSPSLEHHTTYLDVEPITGFTLRFAKRLQVNMLYGPSKFVTMFKKVKDYTYFPVVWLNETAALDDETADRFKKELVSRVDLLETIQIALLSLGSVVCVACSIAACIFKRKDRYIA